MDEPGIPPSRGTTPHRASMPGQVPPEGVPARDVLTRIHREEHSRLLATLVRRFGDLDVAEDVAQEAMEQALRTWPVQGVPEVPLAWLITTAKRAALDRLRRDATYAQRLAELHVQDGDRTAPAADGRVLAAGDLPDDRLAMLMGCCHPAIASADRIALMLRFVGGLTTAEVAQALLLPVPTLQARLTRVKKKIATARIPLVVPEDPTERTERVPLLLTAISLVFTEGYAATSGDAPIRHELTTEAIRLARLTHRLLPQQVEAQGLLALLLLTDARSPARLDADGVPVPLEDQDRARWDQDRIEEGLALAEQAAGQPGAGRFTIQAAIAAVHCEAGSFEQTDWAQIVALYDLLLRHDPGPVVRMNRAIAVGRRDAPARGRALVEALADEPELSSHHPFYVALALFRTETGDAAGAETAWRRALELAGNSGDRAFIERRLGD